MTGASHVRMIDGGQGRRVGQLADLPQEPFQVQQINLAGIFDCSCPLFPGLTH